MARRQKDPFLSYRFNLEIEGIQVAGFAECTGLQMETKVFEYKEGGRNQTTLKFPEHSSYGNITLKRGITQADDYLINWQQDIVAGEFKVNKRQPTTLRQNDKTVAIVLMNEKGEAVKRWNLIAAWPVKWVGPDLKATGNEVAIETLEITHEGIQLQ
jgi:phage tail-like protein